MGRISKHHEIKRFISNLTDDDPMTPYHVFDILCDHFNLQGGVFGDIEIRAVFYEYTGEDATETQVEELWELVDIWKPVSDVAYTHFEQVVSQYLNKSQEKPK